ncbi:hypothetical protein BU24DRAFT_454348 [Aaosphaeria arxii CBS 175.79]|uniref:Folate receptor-like domain-containing protein n=1 Tax=Aaosphaeria arxii CBS 175.79 TaxID=1450172 RepID=A0A6A5XCE7_9PLEO|nr:uncharacterized protein BU24DRAFT_454348 [Aaosphaeria arxii CBS 175.79]KAF2010775.1 hypothetical protein BU24DRAFT_454348 [Aaosphaeria arxii CBS 175.79]
MNFSLAKLNFVYLSFFVFVRLASCTCFLPNGTAKEDEATRACSNDPASPLSKICCQTGWDNAPGNDTKFGPTADECLPSGVCRNRGFSSKPGEEYPPWDHFYRVTCTNQDWDEGGCLDVCSSGFNADQVVQLTPCDDTATSEKWCCGDTKDCCAAGFEYKAVYIPQKLGSLNKINQTLPTGKSNADDLLHDARIGFGVGIVAASCVFFALGYILARYRCQRKLRDMSKQITPGELSGENTATQESEWKGGVVNELDSDGQAHELPDSEQHHRRSMVDQGT